MKALFEEYYQLVLVSLFIGFIITLFFDYLLSDNGLLNTFISMASDMILGGIG